MFLSTRWNAARGESNRLGRKIPRSIGQLRSFHRSTQVASFSSTASKMYVLSALVWTPTYTSATSASLSGTVAKTRVNKALTSASANRHGSSPSSVAGTSSTLPVCP